MRAESLDSPVWCYELSIKTKMLFEEPYLNGNEGLFCFFLMIVYASKVEDPEWSSASHCTCLVYMFGYPFMDNIEFPGGRYFSEYEKDLSKRIMGMWVNFAKHAEPGWDAFTMPEGKYIRLGANDQILSVTESNMKNRTQLWKKNFHRHNNC